jgi:PD-(D/E)XK nuclease superfamily
VGIIDLVRAGGRIVDFKTSARTPDVELLTHTTETQTTSYGLLYREATGGQESGIEIHHLIRTKQPKIVGYLERSEPSTEDLISFLEEKNFVGPRETTSCGLSFTLNNQLRSIG